MSKSISTVICPDCSTEHNPSDGQFCGTCGHNFTTGARGEIPLPPEPSPGSSPAASPAAHSTPTIGQWTVTVSVDPALRDPLSPPAPERSEQQILLEKPVNLIGRTSQIRAIYPEINLDFDDAVSQRHGLLSLQSDGSLIFRDILSSNGTRLNGVDVTVMADLPLQDHDELTLGHWTKLTVRSS